MHQAKCSVKDTCNSHASDMFAIFKLTNFTLLLQEIPQECVINACERENADGLER